MFFLCSMLRLFFVSIYVPLILFVLVVPVNSPFCLIGWTYLLSLKTIYSVHFVPHVLTVPYVLMVPHILLCSILWLFFVPSNVLIIPFVLVVLNDSSFSNVLDILIVIKRNIACVHYVPRILNVPFVLVVPQSRMFSLCLILLLFFVYQMFWYFHLF